MLNLDDFVKTARGAARADLYVCDVQRIDREKCAALIAYPPDLPAPKLDDLYAFTRTAFDGAITPQVATAKMHPEDHAISIVLTANTQRRPFTDAQTMRKITSSLYAEDRTASMWSLVRSSDGGQYLVRNVEEDVHDIVARAQRRNPHHPGLTLASVRTAAPIVEKGDTVKFFGPKNQVLWGVISKLNGDFATIETKHDEQSYTVSRYAIVEVTNRAPDAIARDKARMEDFLALVWGSRELAQKATAVDVNDQGLGDVVPTYTTTR